MATVLHLFKEAPTALAGEAITQQLRAGDRVTAVFLESAPEVPMPAGMTVHRMGRDLSYDGLLEEIFGADQVIGW